MAKKHLKRLTLRQARLAADYVPLAKKLAIAKAGNVAYLREDLIGQAVLALCVAAATWKPALCPRFGTWAAIKIRWAMLDVMRAERPKGGRIAGKDFAGPNPPQVYSLDIVKLETSRDEPLPIPGRENGHLGGIDTVEEFDAALAMIARAPRRCQPLLRRVYLEGMTVAEAGAAEGLTPEESQARHEEAMLDLAEQLDNQEGAAV